MLEITGSSSKLEFLPLPQDDPTQRQPDISVAKRKLGWEPTVELCAGLRRTIGYFRKEEFGTEERSTAEVTRLRPRS